MNNKDKYIVILGMHEEAISMIYEAYQFGLGVIGIDINSESPGFKHVDIPLLIDAKNSKEIINILSKLNLNIVGISQLGIENQPILSEVAEHFKLVHCGKNVSINTTYKNLRYDILSENVNIPNYQLAEDWFDIKMQYPYIIKPNCSSGSRGVYLINNIRELKMNFNKSRGYSLDSKVIVEENLNQNYTNYSEISIEGFMNNNKLYITGLADRNYIYENNLFIEIGGTTPSILNSEIQEKCKTEFEKAVRALGILEGPTKGDLIIKDDKIYVIEVTSRLSGGGFCNKIQKLSNYTNIVKATVAWACGIDVQKEWITPSHHTQVISRYYQHNKSGIVKELNIDSIKKANYSYVNPNIKVGKKIENFDYINRLCYVILSNENKDAEERIKNIFNNIILEID